MSGILDGEVALITGATGGQGREEARLFMENGALVVLADLDDKAGCALAAELGERTTYIPLDVANPSAWTSAIAAAEKEYGPLTILVNNAGILRRGTIEEATPEEYMDTVRVNQLGTWLGMKAVVQSMKTAGHGSIVNISSSAGFRGVAAASAYVSTKWAIRGLTKTAALEFAPYNIRVNSVCPGLIATPMVGLDPEVGADGPWREYPIPRVGLPRDVAQMVLFVASNQASYSTGAEFVCEGGRLAG